MLKTLKQKVKRTLPKPILFLYQILRKREDSRAIFQLFCSREITLPLSERINFVYKFYIISDSIDCPHTQEEIFAYATAILTLPKTIKGCFVEAGCYKGGSTCKLSLVAKLADRKLVVFDSFEGIPENDEPHEKSIFGRQASFKQGQYCGTFEEVNDNLSRYGAPDVCKLIKGWFEDTMPHFKEPIAGIYLDVDLAQSTRTCLKYLYPLLQNNGFLYSQDGHLPLVIEVFDDEEFWKNELGCRKPHIDGLGKKKLVKIVKRG